MTWLPGALLTVPAWRDAVAGAGGCRRSLARRSSSAAVVGADGRFEPKHHFGVD